MTEPLTPGQVQLLEQLIADRQEHLQTEVDRLIAEAVAPLQVQLDQLTTQVAAIQDALGVLDEVALKVGESLALRAANGKLVCAEDGGPTADNVRFSFVSRSTVGAWESFDLERGQD